MAERQVPVEITADVDLFVRALADAAARSAACEAYQDHLFRHHMPEDPWSSAMHAAYDRRRRARRRRTR